MQKTFAKLKNPLAITVLLFLLAIILIKPLGNISVNDDWAYLIQTEAFSKGIFTKSAVVDPTFVLQGLVGLGWSMLFGLNFVSLRILTIIFSLICLWAAEEILLQLETKPKTRLIALLTLAFNPIFFSSALTFMTEIYFLAFMLWNIYFYLRFKKEEKTKQLLLAAVLGGLSLLIRQFGLVLLVGYAIDLALNKKSLKEWLPLLTPFLIFGAISFLWPQYQQEKQTFLDPFLLPKEFVGQRLKDLPWLLPYIGFFLSPLILEKLTRKKLKIALILLGALLTTKVIFTYDIFKLGNIFYVESLYNKRDFVHDVSLFDNTPFKLGLAFYIGICIWGGGLVLARLRRAASPPKKKIRILLLLTIGMFLVVAISKDFYDRYFLNMFVLLIILFSNGSLTGCLQGKQRAGAPPKKTLPYLAIIPLASLSVFLNHDFFTKIKIKWDQAAKINEETGLLLGIYVNGTYARYQSLNRTKDYTGTQNMLPYGLSYECFVQEYTENSTNPLGKFLERIDTSYTINEKWKLKNPEIYGNKQTTGYRYIKNNMGKIHEKEEYWTPIYALLGKKSFVGNYCVKKN